MKLSVWQLAFAGVIVLLAIADSFWVTISMGANREDYLLFAGPVLCLLLILFCLAVTPPAARLATVTALLVGVWLFTVGLAGMYVSCDPGMSPFLPEMILTFFPLTALTNPPFLVVAFGLAALVALAAYHVSNRFHHAIPILVPAAAAALGPVVFFAAEIIFRILGVHSTPGNCVI